MNSSMPSSPDSSSDSSGGSTPAALDGPNLDAENCLPGVVRKIKRWIFGFVYRCMFAVVSFMKHITVNLLTLINKFQMFSWLNDTRTPVLLERLHHCCLTFCNKRTVSSKRTTTLLRYSHVQHLMYDTH